MSTSSCIDSLEAHASHTWVDRLPIDPDHSEHAPNKSSREVKQGLYVPVKPTPLPDPQLVMVSQDMAEKLGLDSSCTSSDPFVKFVSGHPVSTAFHSWATPYALSIMGQEMYQNCPFNNGNGYGDGRAISIAEVDIPSTQDGGSHQRWELQLKGAGTTPFCRSGDGRAVLRSSIREFLASEAMHALGISTTRALSLVVSGSETVMRPWYSNNNHEQMKDMDFKNHPALQRYPPEIRGVLVNQLKAELQQPDRMQSEQCAITCRVAPSFLRVGHIELAYRRLRRAESAESAEVVAARRDDLVALFELAVLREYSNIPEASNTTLSLPQRVYALLDAFSHRLARLTADWIRVGYCQGNFNSDNCLVGGRTMDYGPFGFIEKFTPLWNMWASGGEHFGFMNQPKAGHANFQSCVQALSPLLAGDDEFVAKAQTLAKITHLERATDAVNDVMIRKLGLVKYDHDVAELVDDLLKLLEASESDWTLFWRALADLIASPISTPGDSAPEWQDVAPLHHIFYREPSGGVRAKWCSWLARWLDIIHDQYRDIDAQAIAASMRAVSPLVVPREWMLVEGYTKAQEGDYSEITALHHRFSHPYTPHEDSAHYTSKAPDTVYQGVGLGGTAFMS